MQNYISEGAVLDYTVPESTTIVAGDIVNIGPAMSGIAANDGEEGDVIAVNVSGVFEVPKKSSLAIAVGDELYVDVADGAASKTITHKPLGVAWKAAASDATTVLVKLAPKKGDTNSTMTQAANVAALTDSSGGDVSGTLAAIASGTPADLAAQGVINGIIADSIASLAAKLNAEIAALKTAGIQASA